jgi:predicted GNAT family N-acyltransferase
MKDMFNKQIFDLYKKQDYKIISDCDFWFVLHNDDEIIAECSVSIENDNIYEINDVIVSEKYRGNNYALMLLMNVLLYFDEQNKKLMIKICCEKSYIPAYKTYEKIFGQPYRSDSRYSYFSYNL